MSCAISVPDSNWRFRKEHVGKFNQTQRSYVLVVWNGVEQKILNSVIDCVVEWTWIFMFIVTIRNNDDFSSLWNFSMSSEMDKKNKGWRTNIVIIWIFLNWIRLWKERQANVENNHNGNKMILRHVSITTSLGLRHCQSIPHRKISEIRVEALKNPIPNMQPGEILQPNNKQTFANACC